MSTLLPDFRTDHFDFLLALVKRVERSRLKELEKLEGKRERVRARIAAETSEVAEAALRQDLRTFNRVERQIKRSLAYQEDVRLLLERERGLREEVALALGPEDPDAVYSALTQLVKAADSYRASNHAPNATERFEEALERADRIAFGSAGQEGRMVA